jgi:hypothetical protein
MVKSSRNEAFRIRYKGGGNVGIGTTSPFTLFIHSAAPTQLRVDVRRCW